MRIVIQRCAQASVTIHHQVEAAIEKGLIILLGIEESDTQEDANWLIHKVINLRIFDDEQGVMNRSIQDIQGEMLVVSQFTLFASYKKATVRRGFAPPNMRQPSHSTNTFATNCRASWAKKCKQAHLVPI